MAKHAATAAARNVPAPVPVKVAERVAAPATGRHRANAPATGRHRAPVPARTEASANSRLRGGSGTESAGQGRPRATPRYTPRSSRTRYIRYVGNQEASNTGKLMGEWLAGVVMISIAVPTQEASTGYQKTLTIIMYRLSALTAVFFVLALLANTKAGRAAVNTGLLIDLGIVFVAYKEGSLKRLGYAFGGTSTTAASPGGVSSNRAIPEANVYPTQPTTSGGLFDIPGPSGNSTGPATNQAGSFF